MAVTVKYIISVQSTIECKIVILLMNKIPSRVLFKVPKSLVGIIKEIDLTAIIVDQEIP